MSSIIHIIFILSPSLPEVRVRVATETARCGPGRQEKDWPGPEREGGQVGTLLLSHSYLQQRPGGCWWLVGLARQQQGRLPDRAGLQCSGPELGPGCVGSSRFPWHWSLAQLTATGHSDSSSGIGLVSLRSGCKAPPPCLARKMANKK